MNKNQKLIDSTKKLIKFLENLEDTEIKKKSNEIIDEIEVRVNSLVNCIRVENYCNIDESNDNNLFFKVKK